MCGVEIFLDGKSSFRKIFCARLLVFFGNNLHCASTEKTWSKVFSPPEWHVKNFLPRFFEKNGSQAGKLGVMAWLRG